ncbi:hypothetical protein HZA41_00105 [Candidatus Peregrinibacteria bacterium]|nr:hypothetical protein [Candidatus Peregrinibacteria bacterium]
MERSEMRIKQTIRKANTTSDRKSKDLKHELSPMSLKRIPKEETSNHIAIAKFTVRRIAGMSGELKERAIEKVKKMKAFLEKEVKLHDDQTLVKAVSRLAHFLEKEKQYTFAEIDDLVEKAERMVMVLHRKKNALLKKECRKKRK